MSCEDDVEFISDLLNCNSHQNGSVVKLVKALREARIGIQRMGLARIRMVPIYETLRLCAEKTHITWQEMEDVCMVRGWNPENARRYLEAFSRQGKLISIGDNGIRWLGGE